MKYSRLRRFLRKLLIVITIFITLVFILLFIAKKTLILNPPEIADKTVLKTPIEIKNDSLSFCGNSWLHQNYGGINELYISGSPFELGVKNGKLTQDLAAHQEKYFVNFIKQMIPSTTMLNYLKYFIAYFNKDLDEYIPLDLRKEIYGISLFASDKFDFIGEKYQRILNYHAAHDIGHTIQNMNLVKCTAFSVQNEYTKDSTLLIGRNFDFSAGDNFAKEKLVVFCQPDSGFNFAYISWGGMIGVLSGMNEHGLTITLNSAKSGIPLSAKTPVSLISREVLQYARNINEAYDIISKYDSFVSESFFIGSAEDNKAVVIEKSLDTTAIYSSASSKLVLTNHFQSKQLKNTTLNLEAINDGCSMYRLKRTHELIDSSALLDEKGIVEILRDKNGIANEPIGIGNESAVNQLICHHSVVFNPSKRLMWVSQFPYQENGFLAYDLNEIFSQSFNVITDEVDIKSKRIEASDFFNEGNIDKLWKFRSSIDSIKTIIDNKLDTHVSDSFIEGMERFNPKFYYTHYELARYYNYMQEYEKAKHQINEALECQFPHVANKVQVEELNSKIEGN